MIKDDNMKEYAHYLGIAGSIALMVIGFLAIFGIKFILGEGTFVMFLLMILAGVFIFLLETDSEYLPKRYKFPFKVNRVRAYSYFVVGVLLILSGLPALLIIASAILYIL